jgi:hypothetical protein
MVTTSEYVGPGALTPASEPCSPRSCGAQLRRAGEGARPYVSRGGFPIRESSAIFLLTSLGERTFSRKNVL